MIEQALTLAGVTYYIIYGIRAHKPKIERIMDDIWYANKLTMSRPKVQKAGYGFHLIYKMLPNKDIDDFLKLQKTIKDNTGLQSEIWTECGWLHIRLITHPLEPLDYDKKIHAGIPIGKGYDGFHSLRLDKLHHMLIGGETRKGKTSLLRLMITCALLQNKIDLYLIDLKMVDLTIFKKWVEVKTEVYDAYAMLQNLENVMKNRYKEFEKMDIQKIEEHPSMNRVVIVVDEAAELTDNKGCMRLLDKFARQGAGAGVHLWLATQHPSAANQIMPTKVKQNLLGRIGFKCSEVISSKMIVNNADAYKLPDIPGRAIFFDGDKRHEIQVPYLDAKLVPDLVSGKLVSKVSYEPKNNNPYFDTGTDVGFTIG